MSVFIWSEVLSSVEGSTELWETCKRVPLIADNKFLGSTSTQRSGVSEVTLGITERSRAAKPAGNHGYFRNCLSERGLPGGMSGALLRW